MAPLAVAQVIVTPFDFDKPEQHKALDNLLTRLNRKGIQVFPKLKREAVFLRVPIEHADLLDRAVERMLRSLGNSVAEGGVMGEIADEDRYGPDLDAKEIARIEDRHHIKKEDQPTG